MNRTGISPDENAIKLAEHCSSLNGIIVIGLHAYDGHLRDTDFNLRKEKCDAAFRKVMALNEKLKLPNIIAGGSPAFSIHCKRKNMECSPGTFIYWDKGYSDLCPEQKFLPAAILVTRVISLPTSNRLCLDLGHKSVAAENPLPRVHFLNAPDAVPTGQSEEHLVVKVPDTGKWKVGDVLYGVPVHICPTVALYDTAVIVENHTVVDQWKVIARTRKITI